MKALTQKLAATLNVCFGGKSRNQNYLIWGPLDLQHRTFGENGKESEMGQKQKLAFSNAWFLGHHFAAHLIRWLVPPPYIKPGLLGR